MPYGKVRRSGVGCYESVGLRLRTGPSANAADLLLLPVSLKIHSGLDQLKLLFFTNNTQKHTEVSTVQFKNIERTHYPIQRPTTATSSIFSQLKKQWNIAKIGHVLSAWRIRLV
jgi:hypothetical protein